MRLELAIIVLFECFVEFVELVDLFVVLFTVLFDEETRDAAFTLLEFLAELLFVTLEFPFVALE